MVLLAAGTMALYWPTRHFNSIDLDDPFFLIDTGAPLGLSWLGIKRAMTGLIVANWHPVTNFSFLVTHQFFGTNPGVEHLVNVFFHAANAALLFLVLFRFTGVMWPSVAVTAIFAWHPLRVESVGWISERKDVLFAFFLLLSLFCYGEYARAEAGVFQEPRPLFRFFVDFFHFESHEQSDDGDAAFFTAVAGLLAAATI